MVASQPTIILLSCGNKLCFLRIRAWITSWTAASSEVASSCAASASCASRSASGTVAMFQQREAKPTRVLYIFKVVASCSYGSISSMMAAERGPIGAAAGGGPGRREFIAAWTNAGGMFLRWCFLLLARPILSTCQNSVTPSTCSRREVGALERAAFKVPCSTFKVNPRPNLEPVRQAQGML